MPATIEFVDIAGLVKGASQGEGLGNKFLQHIREVDAIVEVVRCFEDKDIVHVAGALDPIADIETIQTELVLADLETVTRAREKLEKNARGGDKDAKLSLAVADKLLAHLNSGRRALTLPLSPEESGGRAALLPADDEADALRLQRGRGRSSRPPRPRRRRWLPSGSTRGPTLGTEAVVVSAAIESELAELPEAEAREYLAHLGVADSGVSSLIRAAYHLLGLRTYLTAGEKETRAWTIHAGDTAPQAAGVIHSDFERGLHQGRDRLLRRPRRLGLDGRGPREGTRAAGRQGLRRPGRRRDPLQVQRLSPCSDECLAGVRSGFFGSKPR